MPVGLILLMHPCVADIFTGIRKCKDTVRLSDYCCRHVVDICRVDDDQIDLMSGKFNAVHWTVEFTSETEGESSSLVGV